MNSEHQLMHELGRLGRTMASGPSMMAGVMDCGNELLPPVRPSARAPKVVLAGVVALAACVPVALSARGAPVETPPSGDSRLAQEFSRASAVMRARMVATEDNNHIIVYRITKLIYGRFPGKTLRQWDGFVGVKGWRNIFEEGKEVTLYVYREYQRKDGTVICGVHFNVSDENDKRILDIVKSGTHLLPGKGPHHLPFYIRSSQRVVRAKLVKLDDVASHWDVSQTVGSSSKYPSNTPGWRVVPRSAGTGAREKEPRITLSMTPWWLRAEAIVRAQAAQQTDLPQQTDPKQTEKQIQEEFNRLVSTDLKIGRDTILFIRPNDDPTEKAPYSPAFVFPADPDNRRYLSQLAKKIRGLIKRSEHEGLNL